MRRSANIEMAYSQNLRSSEHIGAARLWQWALAVGWWIPALSIALHQNYESWAAVVAFVGAYAGALVGRLVRSRAA